MTPLPQPTVQEAVAALSDRDEFKVIVQFIRDEREKFFGSATAPVMKAQTKSVR